MLPVLLIILVALAFEAFMSEGNAEAHSPQSRRSRAFHPSCS